MRYQHGMRGKRRACDKGIKRTKRGSEPFAVGAHFCGSYRFFLSERQDCCRLQEFIQLPSGLMGVGGFFNSGFELKYNNRWYGNVFRLIFEQFFSDIPHALEIINKRIRIEGEHLLQSFPRDIGSIA